MITQDKAERITLKTLLAFTTILGSVGYTNDQINDEWEKMVKDEFGSDAKNIGDFVRGLDLEEYTEETFKEKMADVGTNKVYELINKEASKES